MGGVLYLSQALADRAEFSLRQMRTGPGMSPLVVARSPSQAAWHGHAGLRFPAFLARSPASRTGGSPLALQMPPNRKAVQRDTSTALPAPLGTQSALGRLPSPPDLFHPPFRRSPRRLLSHQRRRKDFSKLGMTHTWGGVKHFMSGSGLPDSIEPILAPALSNLGEDLLGVKLEETGLVFSWRMEDQMGKAEFNVGAKLLQVLFYIAGDEPATIGLIGNLCGLSLHLTRIMDLDLVFSWKSQGCPDACISESALLIGIERYFDLDGPLDAVWIFARSLCSLCERWQELLTVEFVAFARGTDKSITSLPGEPGRNRPACTDIDRNRLLGFIVNRRIQSLVILTLEPDEIFCPELLNQRHSFP